MDEIAKRREARRRKILENSQDRLQKITGIEQKVTGVPDVPSLENHEIGATHADEFPSDYSNNEQKEVQPQVNSSRQTKQSPQYRIVVIVCLGVFVNYLLLVLELAFKVDVKSCHLNKIFVPILLYEVFEFMSSGKEARESESFLYLLIVANTKNSHILPLFRHLNLITNILQDVMIYFFVFATCHFTIQVAMWVLI